MDRQPGASIPDPDSSRAFGPTVLRVATDARHGTTGVKALACLKAPGNIGEIMFQLAPIQIAGRSKPGLWLRIVFAIAFMVLASSSSSAASRKTTTGPVSFSRDIAPV